VALPISYNVRNLVVRWRVTVLAIGGIALVTTVLVVLMAMASGFRAALRSTGSTENAVLTQRGSNSELTSAVNFDNARAIMADQRVLRDDAGVPLASPETMVVALLRRKGDGALVNVSVRGVTSSAFHVRQGVRIVAGRPFTPGLNELIVGAKAAERYAGLEVGSTIQLQRREWLVTGIFEANGGGFESELWGDLHAMASAFQRQGEGGYNSVTLRLQSAETVGPFNEQIAKNPRMRVQLVQERKYYDDQSAGVSLQILGLATFVAIVMGVGAVFGAMNTMYGIVAARTREIGTLRALGFSRWSILLAFVIESTLLAFFGGLVGCLLALPANGISSATGGANFAEISFAFQITPSALITGLSLAVAIGFFGGLFPAWRASRVPVTAALRA
jgi:putative ABC transport system permease protein